MQGSNVLKLLAMASVTLAASIAQAGVIYATGQNNGDPTHQSGNYYYSIDTASGVARPISPLLSGGSPAALAGTPDDRLLGIQNGQLSRINPFTGIRTNIGTPATPSGTAFDVLSDGRGFVVPFESGFGQFTQTQNLHRVDLTTGRHTAVTTGRTIGDAIDSSAGTPSGTAEPFIIGLGSVGNTLYGVDLDTDSLIRLNPNTGEAAVVGAVGAVQPAGLPVYAGFAAMTGVDTNADGVYDQLFGNVNFLDPDGPGEGTLASQRLGGLVRYDLTNGTWTMVGTNPGLIFFGFGSPIPEPPSLWLVGAAVLLLRGFRRNRQSVAVAALYACALCLAGTPALATPVGYTIQTIPPLPATNPRSQGNAINDDGLATGLSNITGNSETFVFDSVSGTNTSLGNLGLGGGFTSGSGINASGAVVGTGSTQPTPGNFFDRAFVNTPTPSGGRSFTVISPLSGGDRSGGVAINDAGTVVGSSTYGGSTSDRQGFIAEATDGYVARPLGFLPGGNRSFANAINSSGRIGGSSRVTTSGNAFAAIFDGAGGAIALPNPTGTTSSNVLGINDTGVTVGTFNSGTGNQAIRWAADGTPTPLGFLPGGTFSQASDVNDLGNIVGTSSATAGANRAFLFTGGQMFDLNDFVTGPSDFSALTFAQGLNDSGQIVGYGTLSAGGIRGFVLTPVPVPVPEPGTLALLAGAGLLVMMRRGVR